MSSQSSFTFYEFFAGGGMARAGLGEEWTCLFANDFDHKKCDAYIENWGDETLIKGDIRSLNLQEIPSHADLAWASFPCQDLSLAGGGAGLKGERSGTFWPFWEIIKKLADIQRQPSLVVLENVTGAITSHGGKDFQTICKALADESYNFGAIVVDASLFVPQSRPRLFIIGIKSGYPIPSSLFQAGPQTIWHTKALVKAHEGFSKSMREKWIWWNLEAPPKRTTTLSDIIEANPTSVEWHTHEQTAQLLKMMTEVNYKKVRDAMSLGCRKVGSVYKRTRKDLYGNKVQRAEVRFDDIAGCLRTPSGGSSRQTLMIVEGNSIRSRLISSRETARLMGVAEEYILPDRYNEAYHLMGDGLAVPVVRYISSQLLEPVLLSKKATQKIAA